VNEESYINLMMQAWISLRELGWKDVVHCPKDGTPFLGIVPGRTEIHTCIYKGEWPTGSWWTQHEGELWLVRPCLYKPLETRA
jgi:hypothetical protein